MATTTGTNNADELVGTNANDQIYGGAGDDKITANGGDDIVKGGAGNDTIIGDGEPVVENMLQNGSFEADVISGSWSPSSGLTGWNVMGTAAETWQSGRVSSANTASDGNQHLELDAHSNSVDGIYQDVATQEGETYELSIDLARRAGTDSSTNTVEIVWNQEVVASIDPVSTDFTTFKFEVIGTGGDDRLTLREDGDDDNSFGGLIDNVILAAPSNTHNDKLLGGDGADEIAGNRGNDLLAGGGVGNEWALVDGKWLYDATALKSGGDAVALDQSNDILEGGSGDDVLLGGGGNDQISAGEGDDIINAGTGDDIVYGADGSDTLNLEDGNDYARGGNGNDIINAGTGDDIAFGEAGDDQLRGGDGDDQLFGGDGADVLHGGTGDDVLEGGGGVDKLFGGDGADNIAGGDGNDYLNGGSGSDNLSGDEGGDKLYGGSGEDALFGGAGADKLVGGSGADTITGGAGNDHMWGGNWSADGASDTFVLSAGGGKDMIHDFETDKDVLDLSSYGLEFSDLSNLMSDNGWATEIDLSGLDGGQAGDKLILKSIDPDDLDESNFIL